jgi:hypothetical protein
MQRTWSRSVTKRLFRKFTTPIKQLALREGLCAFQRNECSSWNITRQSRNAPTVPPREVSRWSF